MMATESMTDAYATGQAANVRAIEDAMARGTWPQELGDDFGDWLASGVLDYRTTRDSQGGLVAVSLAITLGGPSAWWDVEGGRVTVSVSWGSDRAERQVVAPFLADAVLDYFESVNG